MEQGKRLFREVVEQVWHRGNLAFIQEAFVPAFVGSVPGARYQDLDDYRAHVAVMRSAFPDIRITVRQQVAEPPFVLSRFEVHGTHRGRLLDRPPSGRSLRMEAMTLQRLSGHRIAESWTHGDVVGFLRCVAPREFERR